METKEAFIQLFSSIYDDIYNIDKEQTDEEKSSSIFFTIDLALETLSEFGGTLRSSNALALIKEIKERFKNDPLKTEIDLLCHDVLLVLLAAKENNMSYSYISTKLHAINELVDYSFTPTELGDMYERIE